MADTIGCFSCFLIDGLSTKSKPVVVEIRRGDHKVWACADHEAEVTESMTARPVVTRLVKP